MFLLASRSINANQLDPVYISYCFDVSLFNSWRLHAHSKTMELLILNILFADDVALVGHAEGALQRSTSCFVEGALLFGLDVSLVFA